MEQNSSYVFISYAHKDAHLVLPCVEAMKQSGINLWYDEGIEAGSEWPEFIAQKVVNCAKFVLFISDAYLDSQNCKRELNFAISRKKDILSLYLGDVTLSPGMEMQLGTYQAIYRNRFANESLFHTALCREHYFDICRTNPSANADAQNTAQSAPNTTYAQQQTAGTPGGQQSAFMKAATVAENTWNSARKSVSNAKQSVSNATQNVSSQFSSFFSGAQSANSTGTTVSTVPAKKNRLIAVLLCFFLGWIGVHKFYLRKPIFGIAYLVLFFTYIPLVLSFVEALLLILCSPETLKKFYQCELDWEF